MSISLPGGQRDSRLEISLSYGRHNPPMTRISVLMPVYNGLPYLRQAVESVRGQTCRDWQLVVVDDGSGDGSADYLAGLRDERIVVLRQANRGLASALNHGLVRCDGE